MNVRCCFFDPTFFCDDDGTWSFIRLKWDDLHVHEADLKLMILITSMIKSSCGGGNPSRKSSKPSLTNFQFRVLILQGYFIRSRSRYLIKENQESEGGVWRMKVSEGDAEQKRVASLSLQQTSFLIHGPRDLFRSKNCQRNNINRTITMVEISVNDVDLQSWEEERIWDRYSSQIWSLYSAHQAMQWSTIGFNDSVYLHGDEMVEIQTNESTVPQWESSWKDADQDEKFEFHCIESNLCRIDVGNVHLIRIFLRLPEGHR